MAPVTRNKPISVVTNTTTEHSQHSMTIPLAKDAQRGVAKELQGSTIGPVPRMEFLDRYLPDHKKGAATVRRDFFKEVSNNVREVDRYEPFVDVLNRCRKITGIRFVVTSEKKEKGAKSRSKPDIVVYTTRQGKKTIEVLKWADVEMIIEWKADSELDGFRDDFPDEYTTLDCDTDKAAQTRGQIYSYASEALDNQHRLFVLALTICGDFARFYRFDASSVVVSELISIRDDAEVVVEFFARYGCMTPAERGYDPTVIPATAQEKKLFEGHVKDYLRRVAGNELKLHPDAKDLDATRTVKIQVNNEEDGTTHYYLACKPKSSPVNYSPCGSFSRGFFAVPLYTGTLKATHPDKGKLYWLKDSWRSDGVDSEASIYRLLKEKNVVNLPDIKCIGDVMEGEILQETLNDTLLQDETADEWRRPVHLIHHMIHYRLVTELLIPLNAIEDAQELLLVGRMTLDTISMAHVEAGVHHRNISKSSIMLTEGCSVNERLAVLVNWDCAKRIDTDRKNMITPRMPSWQFVSVALLANVTKPHDIFDDLESLYWVLLYVSRERFPFQGTFSPDLFDEYYYGTNKLIGPVSVGGEKKNSWLGCPTLWFDCKELQDLLTLYRSYFRVYANLARKKKFTDDEKKKLEDFRKDPARSVRELLSYFDEILDNPHASWNKCRARGIPSKPRGRRAEDRAFFKSKEQAVRNGLWRGACNYKPMDASFDNEASEEADVETDTEQDSADEVGDFNDSSTLLASIAENDEGESSMPQPDAKVVTSNAERRILRSRTIA